MTQGGGGTDAAAGFVVDEAEGAFVADGAGDFAAVVGAVWDHAGRAEINMTRKMRFMRGRFSN